MSTNYTYREPLYKQFNKKLLKNLNDNAYDKLYNIGLEKIFEGVDPNVMDLDLIT